MQTALFLVKLERDLHFISHPLLSDWIEGKRVIHTCAWLNELDRIRLESDMRSISMIYGRSAEVGLASPIYELFLLRCLHQKMRVNREWFIEWKCSFNFLISVPNKGDLFIFFFYSCPAFVQRNQFPRGSCEDFAENLNTLAQVNSATRLRLSALISRKPLNTLPLQQAAQTRNFCYLSREHFPSPLHRPDHRVTQSSRQ